MKKKVSIQGFEGCFHQVAAQQYFGKDTVISAKHIHQYKNKHVAAIAGKLAADIYNLDILAPNIHTLKNNCTRFLGLQPKDAAANVVDADKASVNFITGNQKGSLAKVLTTIAAAGINLCKLQSMPIPGSNFKYSFHADMEFDTTNQFNELINNLQRVTEQLTVLGIYKNGKIQ